MIRRTSALLLLLVLAGCGDDAPPPCPDPAGLCIAATFTFAAGDSFHFVGPATYSTPATGKAQIKAHDTSRPYAIAIIWDTAKVTGPATYTPNLVGGEVEFYVTRPHPTKPASANRTSNTRHGSLSFTSPGGAAGSTAAGTFDGIRLIRASPDDTIDLTLGAGSFAAKVK